jgi:hypothetical protein
MDIIEEITKGLPRNRRWRVEATVWGGSWSDVRLALGNLMPPSRYNDEQGTGDIAHFHGLSVTSPVRVELTFNPLEGETSDHARARVSKALATCLPWAFRTSTATLCTEFD